MGVVRVPYLLAELKERGCADESALAQVMQPGCRIGEEDLRKLAANLGLEVSELAPAPENAANTRFKAKLRGGLASFLFEYDGCFRHAEGSSHAEMLGIEQEDDIGLPSRAADAMLLEKTLYQVIARAKYMLGKSTASLSGQNKQSSSVSNLLLGSSNQVTEVSDSRSCRW